jgi:hypothetical protein
VDRVRTLADDAAVLRALRAPSEAGVEPRHDALAVEAELDGLVLPAGVASRAEAVRDEGGSQELRAAGPGLLVVATSWDPGWSALLDDRPVPILRVNHAQLGLVLPVGTHRVSLRYRPRGFALGLALAGGCGRSAGGAGAPRARDLTPSERACYGRVSPRERRVGASIT